MVSRLKKNLVDVVVLEPRNHAPVAGDAGSNSAWVFLHVCVTYDGLFVRGKPVQRDGKEEVGQGDDSETFRRSRLPLV